VILFVRHGETGPNRDGLVLGRAADPELTEEGRRQGDRLAAVLIGEAPVALYTSPLVRARATADLIASACGLSAEADDRLVEIDWGAWEGRPLTGLGKAELARWRQDSGTPPGGESLRSVGERMAEFCLEALDRDRPVVAVSHVSPIKAAAAWAMGAEDSVAWRMHLGLASITRVDRRGTRPLLVSFNETGHLKECR
jgi:broad specificity phosphatase PhoE